jgi:hypothetical protein
MQGKEQWTKRDKSTGAFMDNKEGKKKFKGVRQEK